MRMWLKMAGKTEDEILNFYGGGKLAELSSALAKKVLCRISMMRRSTS